MIYVAHRGNLSGPQPDQENTVKYIRQAQNLGFDVEIDVTYTKEGQFFLGHDGPQEEVDEPYLENARLWCHAKTPMTFFRLLQNTRIHTFWHDKDWYTLTSRGEAWMYPIAGNAFPKCVYCMPEVVVAREAKVNAVADMPEDQFVEAAAKQIDGCRAVCSDYVLTIKRYIG